MILLLDAHALLWFLAGGRELAATARRAIEDPTNTALVSAATVWELGIKQSLGKLRVDGDLVAATERAGFAGLPITLEDAGAAGALPMHHRDPFDRMLIAQATRLDAVVVTRDQAFEDYAVKVMPA